MLRLFPRSLYLRQIKTSPRFAELLFYFWLLAFLSEYFWNFDLSPHSERHSNLLLSPWDPLDLVSSFCLGGKRLLLRLKFLLVESKVSLEDYFEVFLENKSIFVLEGLRTLMTGLWTMFVWRPFGGMLSVLMRSPLHFLSSWLILWLSELRLTYP